MWWHDDYVYRRNVSISAPLEPIPKGHIVTLHLGDVLLKNGKTREDFEDIEVVYDDGEDLRPIYRFVEKEEDDIRVSFQIQSFMDADATEDDKYKAYYGNLNLVDQPTRADPIEDELFFPDEDLYSEEQINLWPIGVDYKNQTTSSYGYGSISYTRPGEHWKSGSSNIRHARASLLIYATDFRIVSSTGPDKAIMEVRVDEEDWQDVDLYRHEHEEYESVYERHDLDEVLHEIQIRVSGRTNIHSLGDEVSIQGVEYVRPVKASDLGEEINETTWISYVGGV